MHVDRACSLERLAAEVFDLVVVGGGIVGAATAALATRHGLSVALIERGDFASGTSSASSKLIHGGLRYLRMGDVRLVREARREAAVLARVVAPHLVRPMPFVVPVYRGGPYRKTPIRFVLALYTALAPAASERAQIVGAAGARERVPALRADGLRAAGVYPDAQTDDARLCLLNVRAAADEGAVVLNHTEVVELATVRGRLVAADVHDGIDGGVHTVRGRVFVNATGPWVDALRRLEDAGAGTSVVLSKGSHLVVDRVGDWRAAVTIPLDRDRVSFAIPWNGMLLLGTTDTVFDGDPAQAAPNECDERQILEEASTALAGLEDAAVRYRFAGLRVLPAGDGATARTRREVIFSRGPHGMLSVAGGKLTTYRRIALSVLEHVASELALHWIDREARPLPGAAPPEVAAPALARRHPWLAPDVARHLAQVYGSLAAEVVALAADIPDALEPLDSAAPDLVVQAAYAYRREWACDIDDVLRRRTTLAICGLDSPELRARVGAMATAGDAALRG